MAPAASGNGRGPARRPRRESTALGAEASRYGAAGSCRRWSGRARRRMDVAARKVRRSNRGHPWFRRRAADAKRFAALLAQRGRRLYWVRRIASIIETTTPLSPLWQARAEDDVGKSRWSQ